MNYSNNNLSKSKINNSSEKQDVDLVKNMIEQLNLNLPGSGMPDLNQLMSEMKGNPDLNQLASGIQNLNKMASEMSPPDKTQDPKSLINQDSQSLTPQEDNTYIKEESSLQEVDKKNVDLPAPPNTVQDIAKKEILYLQHFYSSCITLLNILQTIADENIKKKKEFKKREIETFSIFSRSVSEYISIIKKNDFDYKQQFKKIYSIFKYPENCDKLCNNDESIFNIRNNNNKITTILPGINIKMIYPYVENKKAFWQYIHLIILSVFKIYNIHNHDKINKQEHIKKMMHFLESSIAKTGIMIQNKIFNPYLGLEYSDNYNLNDMFVNSENALDNQYISLESVLNLLGIKDIQSIDDHIQTLDEKDCENTTNQIINILGAGKDKKAKQVCNNLISNIISGMKENGIQNMGSTIENIIDNVKHEDMENTQKYVHNFMNNSDEAFKNIKDDNGNPVNVNGLGTFMKNFSSYLQPMMQQENVE